MRAFLVPPPPPRLPPRHVQGFGLWESLLLVALIGALLTVAFVSQQSTAHLRIERQQAATALWADQQVAGFVASHLRLPCPDVDGDGYEDCGGGSTGLLPILSLGSKADAAARGPLKLDYATLVAAPDLTRLESYWEPETWDGTKYSYGTANGLDLCSKLWASVTADPDAAAYSIGLQRGDGVPDLVRFHPAAALSNALNCVTTISSVNGIALAVDVVNEVLSEQESLKQDAISTIAFNALHIILTAVDMAVAAVGLVSSIATLAEASAALAAAIASCIILVGCAEIPVFTAAVIAAGVAIGLFGAAIAAGAVAIGILATSTSLAVEVANKTGNDAGDQTLDIDPEAARQAAEDADAKADAEEDKADEYYQTMLDKAQDKTNAYNHVINLANTVDPDNTYDADVNAALAAAVALDDAMYDRDQAQGNLDQANKRVADLTNTYSRVQDSCASADLPKEQYKCDAVPTVYQQLQSAQATADTMQGIRDEANTKYNAASTDYANAAFKVYSDFAGTDPLSALTIYFAIDDYRKQYAEWREAVDAYNVQLQVAAQARSSAQGAADAYQQLLESLANPGSGSGSGITVWAGAEAILRQADANGVLE
ncbi:MAG TPA: hypothetical protein VFG73_11025 [Rhodanobacteraceae bacterium]|nr:hypothetical protein [Rhodanobacteraceae bacterium]